VLKFGANAKVNPPLRTVDDTQAIKLAVESGAIGIIATDHAPHSADEKGAGLVEAPCGLVGLETSLAAMATILEPRSHDDWLELLRMMTSAPAQLLGLRGGTLSVGAPADICLIDPDAPWTVRPNEFHTKGRATPFAGMELSAQVWATMVDGRFAYKEGEVLAGAS